MNVTGAQLVIVRSRDYLGQVSDQLTSLALKQLTNYGSIF